MLALQNLSLSYNHNVILEQLNYEFEKNGLYIILGNNGSGKTTLLKSLCGILRPMSGLINVEKRELGAMSLPERATFVNYVDTPFPLPNFIDLEEYITLGYQVNHALAWDAINAIGIGNLHKHQVKSMSRGQQQKAMLAKLFYGDQPIWLLDEPTNYLDYPSVKNFWEQIELKAKEKLIIATVHNPEEALKLGATILLVKNRQLITFNTKPTMQQLIDYLESGE